MGRERKVFFAQLPKVLKYEPIDTVSIGGRKVGKGQPVYIIAEVGANHRGDIKVAYNLIDAAIEAGADAVKFQHINHKHIAADVDVFDSWHGKAIGTLSGFYKSAEMPFEWTAKLIDYANKKKITFLSTPFDKEAVDVLDEAGVAAFKVASYELTDDILLEYVASKGKPVIISTGMADLEEVAHAVKVIHGTGNLQIVILHCVSIYPPKFADLNLGAIRTLSESFKLPIGYSDHSEPPFIAAPLAAVALGACAIETHITNSREGGSNDDPNSVGISEYKKMVMEIRNVEAAISGTGIKQPVVNEKHDNDEINDRWARRSVYAAKDLEVGHVLTKESIITLRPFGGIEPKHIKLFYGKKLCKQIKAREPITLDCF